MKLVLFALALVGFVLVNSAAIESSSIVSWKFTIQFLIVFDKKKISQKNNYLRVLKLFANYRLYFKNFTLLTFQYLFVWILSHSLKLIILQIQEDSSSQGNHEKISIDDIKRTSQPLEVEIPQATMIVKIFGVSVPITFSGKTSVQMGLPGLG